MHLESEERYRMIVETAREGIWVLDTSMATTYVNRRLADIMGYSEGEMLGRSFLDFIDSSSREEVLTQIERRKRGIKGQYEAVMLRKNGEKIWMIISASPIFDQKRAFAGSFAMCSDITARKQAEEKLRGSEETLRVIFNNSHDAIFIHELNGDIIDVNDKMLEMYGVDRCTAKSLSITDHYSGPDNPLDQVPVIWEKVVAGKTQFFEWQARRIDDGALFNVEVSLRRIKLNQRYAILATVRDITARKQAEEAIEILNTNLASHVMELEAANSELETFNYTISHDLRSPMVAISGFSQLLFNKHASYLDDASKDWLQTITREINRMNELIDVLLKFSLYSRKQVEKKWTSLTDIAHELRNNLLTQAPLRQVTFSIDEGIESYCDPDLLRIVLENLLGNAWKYTAGQESALIEFGVDDTGDKPVYFIRDNGPGFDMAYAERVFRPFVRLPGTSDFVGHGIGLATVQRIVQRHGGSAWAVGEPGNGATFYFTL